MNFGLTISGFSETLYSMEVFWKINWEIKGVNVNNYLIKSLQICG